jgi:hypothetical protein
MDRTWTDYPNANIRVDPGSPASFAELILGVWLLLSAFAWRHSPLSMTNTWILGLIIVFLSEMRTRYATTAAAVWLFFSTLATAHHSSATLWNNLIVAVLVFLISLVPNRIFGRVT